LTPHRDESFSFVFNDERVYESKLDNEFRILVVGGTIASGYGVSSLNERFYKVFENQLNQASKGINYRVFSAGVKDYVSGQILMQLQLGLLDFKPDMILYIDGYMDFFAHKVYAQPPGAPNRFLEYQKFLKIVWAIDTGTFSYYIGGLKMDIKEYLEHVIFSNEVLTDDIKKRILLANRSLDSLNFREFNYHFPRNYQRNLNSFLKIVLENKISVALIYPPILSLKKIDLSKKISSCDSNCKLITEQLSSKMFEVFKNIGEIIAVNNNVRFVSLLDRSKDFSQELFIDFFSMNKSGQDFFGTVLFKLFKGDIFKNIKDESNAN